MSTVEILKTVGQVAGIGGLALGIFLILFQDLIRLKIFPKLLSRDAYRLLRLITGAVWSVALAGIAAWVYVATLPPSTVPDAKKGTLPDTNKTGDASTGAGVANTGTQTINGPVIINQTRDKVRE